MMFLSGVYFSTSQLPPVLQLLSLCLLLSVAVRLIRPLILNEWPVDPLTSIAILAAYCVGGFYVAPVLTRQRLLK
jgi:lipooligosaccharide transport system permease protein